MIHHPNLPHDQCHFYSVLASLRSLLDTIEESAKIGYDQPEKADIEKDQMLESLGEISERAEGLADAIELNGIPFGRCGLDTCCHCRNNPEE